MSVKRIYFDESGFTGYNLLDPAQPVFAIASTDIEPGLAEDCLKRAFPKYKGEEFKFGNIIKSTNKSGLISLGTLLKPYANRIFLYITDKKFAAFVKLIDFLIEPSITHAGYDFYADGYCQKYANYIYFGLTIISKSSVYDELVASYLKFSRNPSKVALKLLSTEIDGLKSIVDIEVKPFLDEMIQGCMILEAIIDMETFKETNELQLTTMLAIISYWRQHNQEDFSIIHDESSNFFRQRETWQAITNPDVPPQFHPLGDGSVVEFPLRVIETISVDSKNNYSVQLCDILAGFAAGYKKLSTGIIDDHTFYEAAKAGLGDIMFNGIQPKNVFPTSPPRKLQGPDAVDLMTNIIAGNKGKK